MKKKAKKIGIVVLHFGSISDTFECLLSLDKVEKTFIDIKLYLIDNDPENRIKNSIFPHVTYPVSLTTNKANIGFGGGVNQGVKRALQDQCEYILLLNNDVVLDKYFFKKLIPYLARKDVGIVSPVITYYDDKKKIWCCDGALNEVFLFTTYPHMNKHLSDVSLPKYTESEFGAASLLVRSDVFRKAGFLEEKYFLNVEDVEWCYRARKAGYKLLYVGEPLAAHKVSANTGIRGTNLLGPLNAYYYGRNFFIFLRDHRKTLFLPGAMFGQVCIRMPFYILLRTSNAHAVWMYMRGFIDGINYFVTGRLVDAFENDLSRLRKQRNSH